MKIELTCVSIVFGLRKSLAQIPAFERPSAISPSTSRSRGLRSSTGSSFRRLPTEIEAAAYFVACEAIANAVKHARATQIRVCAERRNGSLVIEVEDDGIGGASLNGGSGLRGLVDRVEAHGGTLRVESEPGQGTRVIGELPCVS